MDIGLAVALLNNSFLLLLLTSPDEEIRKKSYVLVGAIVAMNYVFLPVTWPMALFVTVHIVATSERIALNLFRYILGIVMVVFAYFCVAYFFDFTTWNLDYFPFAKFSLVKEYKTLLPLIPVVLMLGYALLDHFSNYNKKSPVSRFKYTFLLVYSLAQLIMIVLYMNTNYEYLLLLALPASIILSRMIKFLPKPWMQEACVWVIFLSMCLYKIGTFIPLF
jgi:hypothetical protein